MIWSNVLILVAAGSILGSGTIIRKWIMQVNARLATIERHLGIGHDDG